MIILKFLNNPRFRILRPKTVPFSVPLKLKNPHNLFNYKGLTFIVAVWTELYFLPDRGYTNLKRKSTKNR